MASKPSSANPRNHALNSGQTSGPCTAISAATRADQTRRRQTPNHGSRARTQLAALIPTVPETRRQFIELLIEDIQYFGTLSERTLRKIAKPDITTPDGRKEIEKLLDALKGELGPDYLAAYKKTGIEDQVIITVEQQIASAQPEATKKELNPKLGA